MTNSLAAVLNGVQQPQLLHLPPDVHSHVEADEAVELREAYGPPLDESQKITLRAWMGTRRDGTWAAFQAAHAMSRQNGKGDEIETRELFGLVQRGERIIHTAHELETSKSAHLRLVSMFESYDDLRRLVRRVTYGNGDQGVELRNGGIVKYRARTGGGGRGLDDISLVVYDEAQHLKPEHMAASAPTLAVNPNAQMILTGSAGLATSAKWWEYRLNALRGVGGRWAYVEHTAEQVSMDASRRFVSTKPDVNDRAAWAMANPALGTRITEEFLEAELLALGPELFAREHLGVWDLPPAMLAQLGAKIPADAWAASVTDSPIPPSPGEVTMAFDVEVDGSYAAVSVATGWLSAGYVETIEHRPGVGWLPQRMVELVQRWRPAHVVMDGGSGAAAAALGEIRWEFERNGLDANLIQPLSQVQYRAACSSFLQAVVDGKVTRPKVEHDRLDMAGLTAVERAVGDSWVFDRRRSPEPIVALTSAAMARSMLSEARNEPVEAIALVL